MRQMPSIALVLIPLGFLISLLPQVSSAIALLMGAAITLVFGNPWLAETKKYTRPLLSASIVGLGAGMNLLVVAKVGINGIGYTLVGLSATLLVGWLLGKLLKTSRDLSLLINVGTAICGGSAIAAVSSTIRARSVDTTIALSIVFLLNAVALLIFPSIGHYFSLTQEQFGLWSALAIHDTSSVVGATLQYGEKALEVGTTVKLVRALWIIPVTLMIGRFFRSSENKGSSPKFPLFILGFLAVSALVTWIPELTDAAKWIEFLSKRVLVATLFLIGAGLTRAALKEVGPKPLAQGILLWLIVATVNLILIIQLV